MGDIRIMSPPSIPNNSEAGTISAKVMVISMIVLFFAVAFCFLLSLYAKWCWSRATEDPSVVSWRRRTARQGRPNPAPAKRRGLDQATLQSLPVMEYDPKEFKVELECSVCLSELSQGEKVRLLPKCNHGFHVECIDMWFKSHSTCPLCRNSVTSDKELKQVADATHSLSDLGSDSDSDSDLDSSDDHEHGSNHGSVVSIGETPSFPTNVLIWGNEATNSVATTSTSSTSNNVGVTRQSDELVIDIPRYLCDDCTSSPASRASFGEEEAKTPVVSRLKSFKRLLSRGKRVAPWASGSNSADIEPV